MTLVQSGELVRAFAARAHEPDVILVTGAAGFIGRHVIRQLRNAKPGAFVIGLDRRPDPDRMCDEWVQLDIGDSGLASAVGRRPTHIVHLAAICREPGYEWREYFRENAQGTESLVAAARLWDTRSIVYTSTMMVFSAGPFRREESDFCDPDTAYGTSKLLGEHALLRWRAESTNRRVRIARPGVVFGPGDYGNMVRLIRALHARRFAYVGRRSTVKGCIYVKDLVALLLLLLTDSGKHTVYHAVYPHPTRISDIVSAICRAWGISRSPAVVPYWVAMLLAAPFGMLDPTGRRFGIHPRRIQKLFMDTHLAADRLSDIGFMFEFPLDLAFVDWRTHAGSELAFD